MPTLHFLLPDGSTRSVEAAIGASVMQTAIRHNLRGIDAECGGSCACATCHVYVEPGFTERLDPPDAMEDELLDAVASGRQAGSRLSCQIIVRAELDGLRLRVPPSQV